MARGGGGFDFLRREVEVNIQCSIVARGGGGFDFSWSEVEGNILFNTEGVADMMSYEDKLKLISYVA